MPPRPDAGARRARPLLCLRRKHGRHRSHDLKPFDTKILTRPRSASDVDRPLGSTEHNLLVAAVRFHPTRRRRLEDFARESPRARERLRTGTGRTARARDCVIWPSPNVGFWLWLVRRETCRRWRVAVRRVGLGTNERK